jgi:2-oxoglutarate decarboxylase
VINSNLARARGGKVSFTHLIGYAVIRALSQFPSMNVYYDEVDGKPVAVQPAHVNFGIAIDMPKPDGTRLLMVPEHQEGRNHQLLRSSGTPTKT